MWPGANDEDRMDPLGGGGSDTKTSNGIFTDGIAELELGEAGVAPGTIVLTNLAGSSITLAVPTGSILGTVRLPSGSGTKTLATVGGDLGTPSAIDLTNATNVPSNAGAAFDTANAAFAQANAAFTTANNAGSSGGSASAAGHILAAQLWR